MEEKIRLINQNTLPVMILGERGSGKNQLAAKLYLESSMQKYPYITIDCQILNERTWNYVISNYNSPLNDKNNTIFISNIQALSKNQQERLLSFLVDTARYSRPGRLPRRGYRLRNALRRPDRGSERYDHDNGAADRPALPGTFAFRVWRTRAGRSSRYYEPGCRNLLTILLRSWSYCPLLRLPENDSRRYQQVDQRQRQHS